MTEVVKRRILPLRLKQPMQSPNSVFNPSRLDLYEAYHDSANGYYDINNYHFRSFMAGGAAMYSLDINPAPVPRLLEKASRKPERTLNRNGPYYIWTQHKWRRFLRNPLVNWPQLKYRKHSKKRRLKSLLPFVYVKKLKAYVLKSDLSIPRLTSSDWDRRVVRLARWRKSTRKYHLGRVTNLLRSPARFVQWRCMLKDPSTRRPTFMGHKYYVRTFKK